MADGFDTFNQGMASLREGFQSIAKAKEKKKKAESLRSFGAALDQSLSNGGASDDLRKSVQGMIAGSTGGNLDEISKFAMGQMSKQAQAQANAVYYQFIADPRPRDEKLPDYLKRFNSITQADEFFKQLTEDTRAQQKKNYETGIQTEKDQALAKFRSELGTKAYGERLKLYEESQNKRKLNAEDLKKTMLPNVMDDQAFPPGLADAEALDKILKSNPGLPQDTQDTLFYIYKNKQSNRGMIQKFYDSFKSDVVNKMFNQTPTSQGGPLPAPQPPQPAGNGAVDFFSQEPQP